MIGHRIGSAAFSATRPSKGHRGTDGVFSIRPTSRGPLWRARRDGKPVGPCVLPGRTMPLIREWSTNTRRRP